MEVKEYSSNLTSWLEAENVEGMLKREYEYRSFCGFCQMFHRNLGERIIKISRCTPCGVGVLMKRYVAIGNQYKL